jgi:GH25 family lysozyme M1 (1,4-beta-N-acetylmuramidase)
MVGTQPSYFGITRRIIVSNSLGIDTAGCNGICYWSVAKANGVHYAAARATISWGYQDNWFPHNWQGMKEQGIHRLAYHVLYPGQPFKAQAENFLRVVGDDWDDAFPINDIELVHNCSKAQITDCLLGWDEYVSARAPKVIDYSRKQFIDDYTELGEWRKQRDWHLAQYLNDRTKEAPPPPALPIGVTDWLVHQNADHFPAWAGLTPGSKDLDIDRWNGDGNAVDNYFHNVHEPSPAEKTEILWREAKLHDWNTEP